MQIFIDDDAFVRASAPAVYPRLTDISGWTRWWDGITVTPISRHGESERHAITTAAGRGYPSLQLEIEPGEWRHDKGFVLTLTGDLEARAEFWLEEGFGGTIIHHVVSGIATADDPRRAMKVVAAYRATFRRGTWGFKDLLQSNARVAAGLVP